MRQKEEIEGGRYGRSGQDRKVEDERWKERIHYRRCKEEIKVGRKRNKKQWR